MRADINSSNQRGEQNHFGENTESAANSVMSGPARTHLHIQQMLLTSLSHVRQPPIA
jgi:hypothetical protein